MTPLAPHADQAVRHAVDAYIDGRLLPMFEGDAYFETRNSRYRVLDGVLFSASENRHLGAELVGWLIEYPSRSEVSKTWKNGARAVLVDTRNDGVKGPHIIVTSATRGYRTLQAGPQAAANASARRAPPPPPARTSPPPARTSPPPPPMVRAPVPGSRAPQDGPAAAQAWRSSPPPPPAPISPSWGLLPPEAPRRPSTLPPPPPVPYLGSHGASLQGASSLPPPAPLPRVALPPVPAPPPRVTTPQVPAMVVRSSSLPPPPPPPRRLPPLPQPPALADSSIAQRIAATVDAAISAADDFDDLATARAEGSRGPSRLSHGAALNASRPASRSRGFDDAAYGRPLPPPPPSSVPFLLSRSFQRGMPLR